MAWWCMPIIPATQETGTGRIFVVPGQPRQKSSLDPISAEEVGLGSVHLSSQLWQEALKKRITVQASSGKKVRPSFKNNHSKKKRRHRSSSKVPPA
jgi:hypothetical protein